MNELPADKVIHRECGCVDGEFCEVIGLSSGIDAQTEFLNALADGFDESLYDGTLNAAPVGDLVDDGLAMLTQHLMSEPHAFATAGGDVEDVGKVGVERAFLSG